jgi:cytidylate kinase
MVEKDFIIIALDGGAGTGKSTTAHSLSTALNLLHVDTGSHYRAVTRAFLDIGLKSCEINQYLNKKELVLDTQIIGRKSYLIIGQKSYEKDELRSHEINENVSDFSSIESVRNLLFNYQKKQVDIAKLNKYNGIVMEGRDIGTIILPDADIKVFLEADPQIRSNRRINDGESDQIVNRDDKDTSRKIAPLVPANGCVHIDTGLVGIQEVTKLILDHLPKL